MHIVHKKMFSGIKGIYMKRISFKKVLALFASIAVLLSTPLGSMDISIADSASLTMTSFTGSDFTGNDFKRYVDAFGIPVARAQANKGGGWGSTIDSVLDIFTEDTKDSTHYEGNSAWTDSSHTWIDLILEESQEVSRLVFGGRIHGATNKGFPTKYKIWGSESESPRANVFDAADNWTVIGEGTGTMGTNLWEIILPEGTHARSIRFEWLECSKGASAQNFPAARVLLPFKKDTLKREILDLFIDDACTALRPGVTGATIKALQQQVNAYLNPSVLQPYIDLASMLSIGAGNTDQIHEPMVLSQRGDRGEERNRTDICTELGNYDLTGYYVRPGDTVSVFCEMDTASSKRPSIVFATLNRNHGAWYGGHSGFALTKGTNTFTIPADRQDCYAIYFYNPALPAQQTFAPVVRLSGGHKYPVFYYDSTNEAATRKNEQDFIAYLREYCNNVADYKDDYLAGRGEANFAEFWSDKIIISASAKGCLASLNDGTLWNKGTWESEKGNFKYGEVRADGINFTGPAACMEAYEELFDILQNYSGFNTTDPAHPDYRNHNQFLFRAYANGAGAGWAQPVFSGYNAGSVPDGNELNGGWYRSLFTPNAVFQAGWTEYHEIGHIFDNRSIGTSESTNNLYGLYAGTRFLGANRLDGDENRWYNHFTTYINTGILPDNDLLFYPGAVIWQLNAVDFTGTKMFNAPEDAKLSNYGMACRYYRMHKSELDSIFGGDKDSKLVVSFSMACGVNLADHFEYYQRSVSTQAKLMLKGLPKEDRPTWYVNNRTFAPKAFSDAEKNAEWSDGVSLSVNENTGHVTITAPNPEAGGVFSDSAFQCYEAYKMLLEPDGDGWKEVGDPIFVGISGKNLKSRTGNELYTIIDRNIVPEANYRYYIYAYDRTLNKATKVVTKDTVIPAEINNPVTKILINDGQEGSTFNVGVSKELRLIYEPAAATIDLNTINWWVEGWGRDGNHTGGAEDIIILEQNPDYPGDPTRMKVTGVQPGETHVKVSVGGLTATHRVVINGTMNINGNFDYSFTNEELNLVSGLTVQPELFQANTDTNTSVRVRTVPNGTAWKSLDESIATVTAGKITGVSEGTTKVQFYRTQGELVLAELTVRVVNDLVAASAIDIQTPDGFTGNINVNDKVKLTTKLLPENTTESRKVVWRSSDSDKVRVDAKGVVTGISGGTATIICNIEGTNISNSIEITVADFVPLQRLTVDKIKVELGDGKDTEEINVSLVPSTAQLTGMYFTTSNPSVATVTKDAEGRATITAVGTGKCVVTAYLAGKSVTTNVSVDRPIALTDAQFTGRGSDTTSTSATVKVGNSLQLTTKPVPIDATGLDAIEWTSNADSIATVKQGLVTGVSPGVATITGTYNQRNTKNEIIETKTVTATITVQENIIPLTGLGLNRGAMSLTVGDNETLVANLRPVNANSHKGAVVQWESGNTAIADVDTNGYVTAKAPGTCEIRAKLAGYTAVCQLSVSAAIVPVESVNVSESELFFTIPGDGPATLTATAMPVEAGSSLFWSIVGPTGVVSVDQDGRVTPTGLGSTAVRVMAAGNVYTDIPVTVSAHNHDVASFYSVSDTHHWYGCNTQGCPSSPGNMPEYGPHIFQEIENPQALISAATYTAAARYYKSCVCGKIGEEEFSYGNPLPSTSTPPANGSTLPAGGSGNANNSPAGGAGGNGGNAGSTGNTGGAGNTGGSGTSQGGYSQPTGGSQSSSSSSLSRSPVTSPNSGTGNNTTTVATNTNNTSAIPGVNVSSIGNTATVSIGSARDFANASQGASMANTFTIQTSTARVVIDGVALNSIVDQAKDNDFQVVVEDAKRGDLSNTQQRALSTLEEKATGNVEGVFSAYIMSGGQRITNFGGGLVSVGKIGFTPAPGRNPANYHVYYIPSEGAPTRHVTWYDAGHLYYTTGHFSDYAIVYDESITNDEEGAIFRLYNSRTGFHLLTSSKNERNAAINKGWVSEGIEFLTGGGAENVTVYRMYYSKTGEHLYTDSEKEIEANKTKGWSYEGKAFTTAQPKSVYRLYNGKVHHYTSNAKEIEVLVSRGWINEGVAF